MVGFPKPVTFRSKRWLQAVSALTQEKLREMLRYEPETGLFIWRSTRCGPAVAGAVAGTITRRGYRVIGLFGSYHKAHRLVWMYVHGKFPDGVIDHINGNQSDNRLENLRDVTQAINNQNLKRARKDNKSGMLGVSVDRGRFLSRITVGGKTRHLGCFASAEEAHAAYMCAKKQLHE